MAYNSDRGTVVFDPETGESTLLFVTDLQLDAWLAREYPDQLAAYLREFGEDNRKVRFIDFMGDSSLNERNWVHILEPRIQNNAHLPPPRGWKPEPYDADEPVYIVETFGDAWEAGSLAEAEAQAYGSAEEGSAARVFLSLDADDDDDGPRRYYYGASWDGDEVVETRDQASLEAMTLLD